MRNRGPDIKADNIMFGIGPADAAFTAFEQEEVQTPSPRKEVDGRFIYLTRELPMPQDLANPVLCDFGSAVPLDDGREHREDIQPDVYRAPEVIIEAPWTQSVDIWNVGCMVRTYLYLIHTSSCSQLTKTSGLAHIPGRAPIQRP